MPVLCIGPVCIPLNLLLPFLLGVAHHYGWFKWIKREWVTLQHWRETIRGPAPAAAAPDAPAAESMASNSTAGGQRYVCEGGVCRLVPADEAPAGNVAAGAGGLKQGDSGNSGSINPTPDTSGSQAPTPAQHTAAVLRQRQGLQGVKAVDL